MQGFDPTAISRDVANLEINGTSDAAPLADFDGESPPPPSPKLHSKGVIATDITQKFNDAAQKLHLGEVVKDPFFTLFESVGALEIMDRKMDGGFLEPGETMDDEYDYSMDLLPEEVMGIIDQLLLHEVAWHMGHPLSQTIFTSLYVDRILSLAPLNLEQTHFHRNRGVADESLCLQILRAYCLGLIKTCHFVNNRIRSEHYYEEEDFVTQTYHRSLLEDIGADAIRLFLDQTMQRLNTSIVISEGIRKALTYRLKHRKAFLTCTDIADTRLGDGAVQCWNEMLSYLPNVKTTAELAKQVPESFSTKLQRKLASTVPPRPMVQIAPEAAYDHLERLCRHGASVVQVLKYSNPHSLMLFVALFQAQKPQPSVYIRALLQHYIFCDMVILGNMSIRQLLDDELCSLVLPNSQLLDDSNDYVEVPTDPRFQMAAQMEAFRARAAGTYLDMLRTLCQNRCRMRRTLAHSLLDWDTLQLDAEDIDQDLLQYTHEEPITDSGISNDPILSFSLSSWAYFHKLRQMEWLLQMGFELQVYQADELGGMYWHLHYLAKTRSRHLERIKCFVLRNHKKFHSGVDTNAFRRARSLDALSYISLQMLESTSTYAFADALSCFYTILDRLSLIQAPPRPYSSDAMRYEVRMKPFLNTGLPETLGFQDFTHQVKQPEETTSDMLDFATQSIASAKRGLEALSKLNAKESFSGDSHESWVKDVKNCLKACIFTGIGISAVKRAFESAKGGAVKLKADLPPSAGSYHDWWVVPKISPIV